MSYLLLSLSPRRQRKVEASFGRPVMTALEMSAHMTGLGYQVAYVKSPGYDVFLKHGHPTLVLVPFGSTEPGKNTWSVHAYGAFFPMDLGSFLEADLKFVPATSSHELREARFTGTPEELEKAMRSLNNGGPTQYKDYLIGGHGLTFTVTREDEFLIVEPAL